MANEGLGKLRFTILKTNVILMIPITGKGGRTQCKHINRIIIKIKKKKQIYVYIYKHIFGNKLIEIVKLTAPAVKHAVNISCNHVCLVFWQP